MRPTKIASPLYALALTSLIACRVGKDEVVFFTTTSIGVVDGDTAPPKLSVGYDRLEGSIGPVMSDGQVMPLLSGIAMSTNPLAATFGFGISTTFATGGAAIIGTKYAGTDDEPDFEGEIEDDLKVLADYSTRLKMESITEQDRQLIGAVDVSGDVRRYFFATDTSFGLNVAFASGNPGLPEAVSLGWKRKELAIVPVTKVRRPVVQDGAGATIRDLAILPSLLATSTASARLGGEDGDDSQVGIAQLYATGVAANFLMARPDVRNIILERTGAAASLDLRANAARRRVEKALEGLEGAGLDEAMNKTRDAGFTLTGATSTVEEKRKAVLRAVGADAVRENVVRVERLADELERIQP